MKKEMDKSSINSEKVETNVPSAIRKLLKLFTKREKTYFGVLLIGMAFGAIVEMVSIGAVPALMKAVIDPEAVLGHATSGNVLRFFGLTSSRKILMWGSLFLIAVFFLKNLYIAAQHYMQIRYVLHRNVCLSKNLFGAYMHAPYEFHLNRNSAELLRNARMETSQIVSGLLAPLLDFLLWSMISLAIFGLLLATNPILAVLTILIIGVAGGGYQIAIRKNARKHSYELQLQRKLLVKKIQQGLGAVKEARILQREKFFLQDFVSSLWRTSKAQRYHLMATRVTQPFMEFAAVLGLLGIAVALIIMGESPSEIAPTVTMFALALVRLKAGVSQITAAITKLRFGAVSVEPVYNDLMRLGQIRADEKRSGETSSSMKLRTTIDLQNVYYRYPSSHNYALRNITLSISKGELVGVTGPTGSGKSTIMDLLLGLISPDSGSLKVNGIDIAGEVRSWQKNIGYVPQTIYLTDDTIRNNVCLGMVQEEIDAKRLDDVLAIAQLTDFVSSLPKGVNTEVGELGTRLSGGQRQRIGIARALYRDPDILVLDEATSSLDSNTERAFVEAVNSIREDRTIITIAHRLSTIRHYDKIFYVEDGLIVQSGKYDDLVRTCERFKRLADS